jgi:hypothetical protein
VSIKVIHFEKPFNRYLAPSTRENAPSAAPPKMKILSITREVFIFNFETFHCTMLQQTRRARGINNNNISLLAQATAAATSFSLLSRSQYLPTTRHGNPSSNFSALFLLLVCEADINK